jgi:hypothetical protein
VYQIVLLLLYYLNGAPYFNLGAELRGARGRGDDDLLTPKARLPHLLETETSARGNVTHAAKAF